MTRSLIFVAACALMIGGWPTISSAQSQDNAAQESVVDDVVVDGRRLSEAAKAFVDEIGAPPPGTRPARWNSEICISVTGLQERFARYLIDRMSVVALDAGVDVEGPGCRPNVIVLATNDAPALASELVERAGLGFRPSISATHLGRSELDHFRTGDSPVRWWHVSVPVVPETGQLAIGFKGDGPQVTTFGRASRVTSNVRYDIGWAVIVIDMSRTDGAAFGALSDYVALAALTQLDPFADLSREDSILNLFNPEVEVAALTDWDRAYLTALYTASANRATGARQTNDIARRLAEIRQDATSGEE